MSVQQKKAHKKKEIKMQGQADTCTKSSVITSPTKKHPVRNCTHDEQKAQVN
jgi:hypothetical protein